MKHTLETKKKISEALKGKSKSLEHRTNLSKYWRKSQYMGLTSAERQKRYRQRKQGAILWYKLLHPCVDCGESDIRVLDFDHIRGDKLFQVQSGKYKVLSEILVEIEKCDVVCANCHRIRTQERINTDGSGSTTFADFGLGRMFL